MRSRSLILTGILVLVITAFSVRAVILLPLFGFYLLVLILDALAGTKAISDLQVNLPSVFRFSKKREGIISVLVHNASSSARKIRIGLPLPAGFAGDCDLWLDLPQGTEYSRADFSCIPSSRGKYRVPSAAWTKTACTGICAACRYAAKAMDCSPDEQNRLSVIAGTE